ncbi:MAG: nucleotidyltransferase domain-containing protein [Anaerolineae bacterium]|nr:nucleotidyltransferase domain-containing protein [Anaerolineae bacterium]
MDAGLERVLRELRRRLQEALGPSVRITLFGSYARGEATEGSDVDVLAVVPRLDKHTMDTILSIAWEVGFEAGLVFSLIPVAEDELGPLSESPFMRSVEREGIPL